MQRWAAVIAIGGLTALVHPAFSATQQDFESCKQTNDLNRSVTACTRIVSDQTETASNRVLAYIQRGNISGIKDNLTAAIADYSEAIRLDPRNVLAYSRRAITYLRKHDREHAVADYRQANILDPAQVSGMVSVNSELKEIASDSSEANRDAPPTGAATSLLLDRQNCTGDAYVKWDIQITACTSLIDSNTETTKNRAVAYFNRGRAHGFRDNFAQAIADYTRAIQLDPGFAKPYYMRGAVRLAHHIAGGDSDRAKAIEVDPNVARAVIIWGKE